MQLPSLTPMNPQSTLAESEAKHRSCGGEGEGEGGGDGAGDGGGDGASVGEGDPSWLKHHGTPLA